MAGFPHRRLQFLVLAHLLLGRSSIGELPQTFVRQIEPPQSAKHPAKTAFELRKSGGSG